MKIGIIGPQSSCALTEKNLHEIDRLAEVKCYPRERVNACGEVLEVCEQECDVILFTGCAIESFVSKTSEIHKPYTSIEKSISSVSGAFLEMVKQGMELDAFSIDIVGNQVVEDLLDAFKIQAKNVYSCPFQPEVDEQEYVDWHEQLQKSGKTNVALTAFAWVSHRLKEDGYHVIYLGPQRAMVRNALERLKSEYALNKAEYSRVAVEILQLTNYEQTRDNYYAGMLKKTEIEQEIIRYVKSIQGAMFAFGRREYVVFSNAGAVKEGWNEHQLLNLQESVGKSGIDLNAGIGMGTTAYKAEMNARKALDYTLMKNALEIYRIDESDTLEGPLGKEQKLQYDLISSDPKVQDLAERTGLSVRSVLKIMAIADARKSYVFDAHELAQCLEITDRSARRIMNKLLDAELGRVYAKETALAGGRPKALVEILF